MKPMGPASLAESTGISSGYISCFLADKNLPDVVQSALGFHTTKYFDMQVPRTTAAVRCAALMHSIVVYCL